MKKSALLSQFFVVLLLLDDNVETLEPITTGTAIASAILSSGFFAGYTTFKCKIYECCDEDWVISNFTGLSEALKSNLHGQHLVVNTVVKSIKGHVKKRQPTKALVLSLHGWTGGGKNYVSKFIAEHLYTQGLDSRFVHLFVATLHFPHESHVETYKDQLREWIKGNITECGRSLFIFDEMDKMPAGLIDSIKPYLDFHEDINGVDYRRSIFLFLSNTGGNDITIATLDQWQQGKPREELTQKQMENVLHMNAFNEKGGLWHSDLIEKNLISAFVPFLPMERQHVKQCIIDDMTLKGHTKKISDSIVNQVADELQYFPKDINLYSKSGCKRVSQKVDLVLEEL